MGINGTVTAGAAAGGWSGETIERLRSVPTISPRWQTGEIFRAEIFPAARRATPKPLLYVDGAPVGSKVVALHDTTLVAPVAEAVCCYFSSDIVVSGHGLLWLDQKVITAPDLMPHYWRRRLSGMSGVSRPETDALLPIRVIDEPCICAIGWGGQVYGHILIEMIPRLLLAIRTMANQPDFTVLLRSDTPPWVIDLAIRQLDIEISRIRFFNAEQERVLLSRGIFPALLHFHPALAPLIDSRFAFTENLCCQRSGLFYLPRKRVTASRRATNEAALMKIAEDEFGARIVVPEELPWPDQVSLFQCAEAIVGLHGSALHTALFSGPGLKLGVVGTPGLAQSHIANLRNQRIAYQLAGFMPVGDYLVPEDGFRSMLAALTSSAAAQQ